MIDLDAIKAEIIESYPGFRDEPYNRMLDQLLKAGIKESPDSFEGAIDIALEICDISIDTADAAAIRALCANNEENHGIFRKGEADLRWVYKNLDEWRQERQPGFRR
jgi:hypothetical protein